MTLQITIEQDAACDFFQEYSLLTRLQQEIFRLSRWYCINHEIAFPNQSKMALKLKCSRKYLNQTLGRFQKLGWIFLYSRGKNRSKVMCMVPHLMMLDLNEFKYFKRYEVTSRVTHISTPYIDTTSDKKTSSLNPTPPLKIAKHLEFLDLPIEAKLKLSLVSEAIYNRALETAKYMSLKKKITPGKEIQYVIATAIRMAMKEGYYLNWNGFYAALKQFRMAS